MSVDRKNKIPERREMKFCPNQKVLLREAVLPLVTLSQTILSPLPFLFAKFLIEVTVYALPFFRQVVAIVISWPTAKNSLKRYHLV